MQQRRSAGPSRATIVALVLAALLGAPIVVLAALGLLDYAADDYWQLCGLAGRSFPGGPDADAMFRFFSGDAELGRAATVEGAYPWYADPTVKLSFWRPLSALTHRFDYALFGDRPTGAKIHGLIWYLALVAVVGKLYSRILSREVAGLAIVVFAIAGPHWQIVAWLAARNATISAVFVATTILLHLRWREDGSRAAGGLALMSLAAALAAGEASIAALAYLAAYELLGRDGALRTRIAALLPALALTAAWLAAWLWLGFGTAQSGAYLNPFEEPLLYLQELPERVTAMIAMAVFAFPADLWFLEPSTRPAATVLGILAVVALLPLLSLVRAHASPREFRTLVWLAAGSLLAMLPQAAGFLGARSLTLPSLGTSAVLAACLVASWRRRRRLGPARRFVSGCSLAAVGLANLLVSPASWVASDILYSRMCAQTRVIAEALRFDLREEETTTVVVLQAPDPFLERYFPFQRRVQGLPTPRRWRTLSLARHDHLVHRTGEYRFELEIVDGRLLDTPLEQLFRPIDHPFAVGDMVDLDDMQVEILATDALGPTRVGFDFDRSLDDPGLRFLAWRDGRFVDFKMPPVSGHTRIAWSPGPTSL